MRCATAVVVLLVALSVLGVPPAGAAPPNDNFADAATIDDLDFSATVDTTGATVEAGEPPLTCGASSVGATVWWKFTPASTVHVKANTFQSSFNTVMALYEGTSLGDLVFKRCNNDVATILASRVADVLEAGKTYYFQVGGVKGTAGTLRFRAKRRQFKIGTTVGNQWLLNDCPPICDGTANLVFAYGQSSDWKLAGNYVGHGVFTPWVRRDRLWLANDWFDSSFAKQFIYGNVGDWALLGDWNGDGTLTPGVRRGNVWYLNNGLDSSPDIVFAYGSARDWAFAGDWDGDGIWSVGVRKGNVWYLNNGFDGASDIPPFGYGSSRDYPFVGDWDGDGTFTPGVRKGNVWYLNNGFDSGHDIPAFAYGSTTHRPIIGDWDGVVE